VLDEATSSLDTRTADEVMTAIQELRGGKTLIVIAHRIDTLRKCDRLIFLREGRIVDTGSFGELMSRDDEFARMASVAGGSVRL
jgi:ABC-type multidrug transport system fused ATPase/permease subunit